MINNRAIICLQCRRFMAKINSGIMVASESMAGRQACDLYECPSCKHRLLTDFGGESGPFDSDRSRLDHYFEVLK